MRHPAFIVATLTGSLLFGASVAGALRAPGGGSSGDAQAPSAAATPSAGVQSAALVAAIEDQFPGHLVEVALDSPAIVDAGPAQQEVEALARVWIDGSTPMLVRANALYDLQSRRMGSPSLWFEAQGERPVPDAVRGKLAAAATRRLGAEFAGQPVTLALADAEAVAVGGRYLRLMAHGVADFGAEGRAAATIEALYDPESGEWLRLDYTLGEDPAPEGDGFAYAGH